MGKASRRKAGNPAKVAAPPFVARPFEGLAGETDWVAMREIVPAATAPVTFSYDGSERPAVIATVLPMAWRGLHRQDGTVFVALQAGGNSGDSSRDLAEALLAVAGLPAGEPLVATPKATADSPRLQDLLTNTDFPIEVHDGFDFWLDDQELDEVGQASMERANEAVVPTVPLTSTPSAYWAKIGNRTYVRWILAHEEDRATDALARLKTAGEIALGEDGKFLGAFRASGLLVPVWEVDADADPMSHDSEMAALAERFETAIAVTDELSAEERRIRNGITSRQVTLR